MEEKVNKDLRVSDAAYVLGVTPKTVTRWCNEGKIDHYRTLGGHRRIKGVEMERLMDEMGQNGR